jgi:hypothetical protein
MVFWGEGSVGCGAIGVSAATPDSAARYDHKIPATVKEATNGLPFVFLGG